MGDHWEKEVIDELQLQGVEGYLNEFLKSQGQHNRGFHSNIRGIENEMKMQSKWNKARERLQARLALKAVEQPPKKCVT